MNSDPKDAFLAALEKDHGRQLRRFLAVRMRNAASDVPVLIQEVFMRLLRVRDQDTIRNPRAYLYTIASHVLSQHVLKEAARCENGHGGRIVAAHD